MTGLLLVDKAAGMTSHDVVDRIRRAAGQRRVGHTGTLDPGATGLLIMCLGHATRLSEHLTGLDKQYEGEMRLGITTDSYDLDGTVTEERPVPELSLDRIQTVCNTFIGEIEQIPPMVSAVKIGGERLYKIARQGGEVERPPRRIKVYEFSALDYAAPSVRIRVRCSSGAYVRGLCHDAGNLLGCGAVLANLRRTKVGAFQVEDALPVDSLSTPQSVEERLLSMDHALDLPCLVVRNSSRHVVANGGILGPAELKGASPMQEGWVQLKSENGRLLALGTVEPDPIGLRIRPRRVFIQ